MPESSEAVEREYGYLTEGVEPSEGLAAYLQWLRAKVLPLFVEKDANAIRFQQRHQFSIKFIYTAAAVVIGIVITQTLFWPKFGWLIWGEVVLIAAMLYVQRWDRKGDFHGAWMQNRYLAERLRCGFFTFLFKQPRDTLPATTPASFLALQDRDVEWEKISGRIDFDARPELGNEAEVGSLVSFIRTAWLQSQEAYHRKTAHRKHEVFEKIERWGICFLVVTVIAAVLHALGVGHYTPLLRPWDVFFHGDPGTRWTIGNLLTLVAILLPAVSASMNAVKNGLEIRKMALRSERVAHGIGRYQEALGDCTTLDEVREVMHYVERFFMTEHEEWHSLLAHKAADVG